MFLLQKTTTLLQALDSGLIDALRSHCHFRQISMALDRSEKNRNLFMLLNNLPQ